MTADNVAGARTAPGGTGATDAEGKATAPAPLIASLTKALRRGQLPEELEDFSEKDCREAA